MPWQTIDSAPKDGTRIICWARNWNPIMMVWKRNTRIESAHKNGKHLNMAIEYFGDPWEYDDYDFAEPGGGPTHWHPLDPVPEPIDKGRII